ncbi:hypothetical protein PHMEG_00024225 [Phytophthora megakarya]|uniref:MULE transposase domain-containing protein n=1 Tax=Phytophthora megakarya TaxID=4795 RepID=A0A225VG76_9STRA|nr:hypothetical protein PHMEG_00024225 [Phytophthora megakarya]
MQMSPRSVTCEFKAALIKGIRDRFPSTPLIGCLFHWELTIRRKQVDLRIPDNQIAEAMAPGVIYVLTVIRIDDIRKKAFHTPDRWLSTRELGFWGDKFWLFFTQTWTALFPPALWNVHSIDQNEEMRNRTKARFKARIGG